MNRSQPSRSSGMLISVGLAFFFWLLNALSKEHVDEVPVRFAWTDPPAGRMVVNRLPDNGTLVLQASGWNLLSAHFRRRTVRLELARFGERSLLLTDRNLDLFSRDLPREWTLLGVDPDTVRIDLDREGHRRIPVSVVKTWDFAPGYGASAATKLSPDSIDVWGPAGVLDTLDEWPTKPLDATAIKASLSGMVDLADPGSLSLRLAPMRIAYQQAVEPFTEGRLRVPIRNTTGASWRLVPAWVEVRFQAPLSGFERIGPADFLFGVDASDTTDVRAAVRLLGAPPYTRSVQWEPREVDRLHLQTQPREAADTERIQQRQNAR